MIENPADAPALTGHRLGLFAEGATLASRRTSLIDIGRSPPRAARAMSSDSPPPRELMTPKVPQMSPSTRRASQKIKGYLTATPAASTATTYQIARDLKAILRSIREDTNDNE